MGVEAWHSDLESEIDVPQGASQIQTFLVEIKTRSKGDGERRGARPTW